MDYEGLVFDFLTNGRIEVATCSEESSLISFIGKIQTNVRRQKLAFVLVKDETKSQESATLLSYVYCNKDGLCRIHFNVFGMVKDVLLDKRLFIKTINGDSVVCQSEMPRVEKVVQFTLPNYESETYGTNLSVGQSIELLSLTQNYMLDLLSTEDHMEAMTKSYAENDVSLHKFYKLLNNYEQCNNTKDMLRLDALCLYPMLRQLKWKISFEKLVFLLNLLCEIEVPLSFLLILETCLQSKEIVSERTNLLKIPVVSTNINLRKEIISSLCLCRTIMRAILDKSSDTEIDECLLCITRYLEDTPLMLSQPVIKARSIY